MEEVYKNSTDIFESIEGILTEEEPEEDVIMIASKLLKQAVRLQTCVTLKTIMMLTAIVSYEKLYCSWKENNAQCWKSPRKAASLAVAAQMGKGPAFACKI